MKERKNEIHSDKHATHTHNNNPQKKKKKKKKEEEEEGEERKKFRRHGKLGLTSSVTTKDMQ